MPIWGCIADDITGATDLATNFVGRGLKTVVFFGVPADTNELGDADVAIIALKTRTAPVSVAADQSLSALRWLVRQGTERFYVKYCSTFDSTPAGNIGTVIDTVLTELDVAETIVVPSFPAAGRTVYQGHLFVHSQLLDESPMKDHPLTPMRDSDVARLLQPQTAGSVTAVPLSKVREGSRALRAALETAKNATDSGDRVSVVVDAIEDADLTIIMEAASGFRVVTGGSGLALGLDTVDNPEARRIPVTPGLQAVLCGSASTRTREQIGFIRDRLPARQVHIGSLRSDFPAHIADIVTWAQQRWSEDPGTIPVVYSVGTGADVEHDNPVSAHSGHDVEPTSALVERALATIAEKFVEVGVRQLVVAGGESSGRVMQQLGVTSLRIGPEISPGVAWSSATGRSGLPLTVALKSGNFGQVDMFTSCWSILDHPSEPLSKENV